MTEPYIKFDEAKFVDTVHYICELFADRVEQLGQVKLHKILYFADMTAYYERGEPLTGVEYQKRPFGPTARFLGKALKQLTTEARLEVSKTTVFGYKKAQFRTLKPLESNRLSVEDKALIKAVADWAGGLTAVEISELSHDLPWQSVRQGERIDYITAGMLFPQNGPSKSDMEWARAAARQVESGAANVRSPN